MFFSPLSPDDAEQHIPLSGDIKALIHPGFVPFLKQQQRHRCPSCFTKFGSDCKIAPKKCKKCGISPIGKHPQTIDHFIATIEALHLNPNLITRFIPEVSPEVIPSVFVHGKEIDDVIKTYYHRLRENIGNAQQTWNRIIQDDPASFYSRLSGKKGRFRLNLLGKRTDFSARAVLTPAPDIGLNQIRIPRKFSTTLTIPERVCKFNRLHLQNIINIGLATTVDMVSRDIYPARRIRLNGKFKPKLIDGDIVHRHLKDGDWIMANRQPTLERGGMLGHQVILADQNTISINLATTPSYGADFDGDEINLHCPQTIEARTELEELLDVYKNMENIHQIQDTVLSQYLYEKEYGELHPHQGSKMHELESAQYFGSEYLRERGFSVGYDDLLELPNCGSIRDLVDSGAKGKQQNIDHILEKYLPGLDEDAFFSHMQEGRVALVESSLMTAETGYLQRCLVKCLEDIIIGYYGDAHMCVKGINMRVGKKAVDVIISFADVSNYALGTAAGIIIAQTIGEHSTQLSLDSFHRVGDEVSDEWTFNQLRKLLVGTHQQLNQIAKTYGIEAANLYISDILYNQIGVKLSETDCSIVADWMTWEGTISGMTSTTQARRTASVLSRASFERTTQHLYLATANQEYDSLTTVSSCVISNQIAKIGTGIINQGKSI
tara:strand:+ start:66 stop:2054 length:1989 start_codon:yes stop_codon:yes gene_type:complete